MLSDVSIGSPTRLVGLTRLWADRTARRTLQPQLDSHEARSHALEFAPSTAVGRKRERDVSTCIIPVGRDNPDTYLHSSWLRSLAESATDTAYLIIGQNLSTMYKPETLVNFARYTRLWESFGWSQYEPEWHMHAGPTSTLASGS